jgi:hypothetical protein
LPRRSKVVLGVINDIKEQPFRRPRRKREPKIFPDGFPPGTLVQVESNELKKPRLGYISDLCKFDGGLIVRLSDDGDIAKYVCIKPELGDKVVRLNSSPNDGNIEGGDAHT